MKNNVRAATKLEVRHFHELVMPYVGRSERELLDLGDTPKRQRNIFEDMDRFGYVPDVVGLMFRLDSACSASALMRTHGR